MWVPDGFVLSQMDAILINAILLLHLIPVTNAQLVLTLIFNIQLKYRF